MSHELRTPLARIRTEGELALRRERDSQEYREALETVVSNATQMTTIIETLVAAEQSENGLARGRCDAGSGDPGPRSSRSPSREGGVRVEARMPGARLMLGVDADVAATILQPVVENACRLAGSVVRLSAQRGDGEVEVRVDDDGPGVREDERESIFEPGTRGSAAADARARRRGPRARPGAPTRPRGRRRHRRASGHGRRPLPSPPAGRLNRDDDTVPGEGRPC